MWLKELEGDPDEKFLTDGLINEFPRNPVCASYLPAEMHNYKSSTDPLIRDKVEEVILEEIKLGNYVIVKDKPVIVSALGAIPKSGSSGIHLVHDCGIPKGRGFNMYSEINYFKFQTLDDAIKLPQPGYFMAKTDLKSAYRSISIHPVTMLVLV